MGIFSLHRRIVEDYASHIRSFVTIADEELGAASNSTPRTGTRGLNHPLSILQDIGLTA